MIRLVDRSAEYLMYAKWGGSVDGGWIISGVLNGNYCIWHDRINSHLKDGKEHLVSFPYEVLAEFETAEEILRCTDLLHRLVLVGGLCYKHWFSENVGE